MKKAEVVLAALSARPGRRQRAAAAREAVGEALRASAERAGAPRALPCEAWPREAGGAPAVVRGWHASWSDTPGLVAALVAPCAVGLDVERLARPRWQAAREHFRAAGELAALAGEARDDVLALWCAKEALLKLARVGLADLGRVRLVRRAGELFHLAYAGREHAVRVHRLETHVLALAACEPLALALHELQEVP